MLNSNDSRWYIYLERFKWRHAVRFLAIISSFNCFSQSEVTLTLLNSKNEIISKFLPPVEIVHSWSTRCTNEYLHNKTNEYLIYVGDVLFAPAQMKSHELLALHACFVYRYSYILFFPFLDLHCLLSEFICWVL